MSQKPVHKGLRRQSRPVKGPVTKRRTKAQKPPTHTNGPDDPITAAHARHLINTLRHLTQHPSKRHPRLTPTVLKALGILRRDAGTPQFVAKAAELSHRQAQRILSDLVATGFLAITPSPHATNRRIYHCTATGRAVLSRYRTTGEIPFGITLDEVRKLS